ncbi:MAG: hypothetical protein M3O31_03730 [Acidobacteriota bacterium]|nr:hypothetical protein [Acidobacteriota bacterium]
MTQAVPLLTSVGLPGAMYFDVFGGPIIFQIYGSGFDATTTVSGSPASVSKVQLVNSGQITAFISINSGYSLGTQTIKACMADGTHCSTASIALPGNQNSLAIGPDGELYSYDPTVPRVVWKFKPDGTADGSIALGIENGLAVDNLTGDLLTTSNAGNDSLIIGNKVSFGDGNIAIAVDARDGVVCIPRQATNALSCVNIPTLDLIHPSFNTSSPFGSQPWSIWMTVIGGKTIALVSSRDGSPTLWEFNVSGGNPILTLSLSLPGITPVSSITTIAGGWQLTGFTKGPAAGIAAYLSTRDNKLLLVNATTMSFVGSPITLPGFPWWIASDETNGKFIVASIDTVHQTTTFASVNPTSGLVTPILGTAPFVATGVRVSPDGTTIIAVQGRLKAFIPNQ